MSSRPAKVLAITAFAAGCGEPAPPAVAMPDGWPVAVVSRPQDLAALLDGRRDGWIAFHRGDLAGAARAFGDGVPAARARLEQAAIYDQLARMSDDVWRESVEGWASHGGLPPGSALPLLAALAAADAGDTADMRQWLDRGAGWSDPDVAAAASALPQGLAVPGAGKLGACLRAHAEARATGDAAGLSACSDPLIVEQGADAARELYDPLRARTLSAIAHAQAKAALGGQTAAARVGSSPALDALLFGPWWSGAALAASLNADGLSADSALVDAGTEGGAWVSPAPLSDDADAARAWIGVLDARLDGWTPTDPAEGAALLRDLDLVGVYRSRVLLGQARAALAAARPRAALVYAQAALDYGSVRVVGPRNAPGLYAALAEAWYRTGHTREALDALQPLADAWPELAGLDETIGDLAILQSMGRMGDSKEN